MYSGYDKVTGGERFPLTEILVERNPTKNDLRKYGLDSWTNSLLSLDNYHWEVEKARIVNEWAERYRATKVAPAEAGTIRQILEIEAVLDEVFESGDPVDALRVTEDYRAMLENYFWVVGGAYEDSRENFLT